MLDDSIKTQVRTHFQLLKRPVELSLRLDDSPASASLRQLADDLASVSDLVHVREASDEGRRPAMAIHGQGEIPRLEFAGLPMGHEFTSLLLAVLQVGGHPGKHDERLRERGTQLKGVLKFVTYFSESCQNCPELVQALNFLTTINPQVEHVAVNGGQFAEEVETQGVKSVPSVYRDGVLLTQGRMDLRELLDLLQPEAAVLEERPTFDTLIVGGGPAGAAAAIYAARKGIATGLVAERFGGQVLDTKEIDNFVSVVHTEGPKFAAALEAHVADYPVDVMTGQRVKQLHLETPLRLELEKGGELRTRSLVVATGARWRTLGVPGEAEYRTRGVTFCPHCDGPLFKGKRVAVVGGGNSGVEAAIDLAGIVAEVTLLEFAEELKADAILQDKLRSLGNVRVVCSAQVSEIHGDEQAVTGLSYSERISGTTQRIELEGVFVQIGLVPNASWLPEAVALSGSGEIKIDPRGQTSVPGVFAAGDVTDVPYKQIVVATGEGAKAALSAFDFLIRGGGEGRELAQPA